MADKVNVTLKVPFHDIDLLGIVWHGTLLISVPDEVVNAISR